MKVKDLFTKLAYGELSNLSIAGDGSGVINPAQYTKLIHATNDALKDMFGRIQLNERELIVESLEWKSLYYLRKEHAKMDPTAGVIKYILDTPSNLFTGDLVKILGVTNEVGDPLPLNDAEQWASVFTPYFDAIQLNHPDTKQVFGVRYQALHPTLLTSGDDVLEQHIRVPALLEEMLRTRVAYGIFSAMSGQEYSIKAQQLEAAYEMKYSDIDQKNLIGDVGMSTNVKIHRRGFP